MDKETSTSSPSTNIAEIRPWVRFWARSLDVYIFALIFGLVFGLFFNLENVPDILFGMIALVVWVFIEAVLLSSWGTTPGKWLLKVRVQDHGAKLEFSKALNRSFYVWFRGLGFGIPIITLFTQSTSYDRLKKQGITPWDEKGGLKVSHKKIGFVRITFAVLIVLMFFSLIALGSLLTT
ncbi:MAG: RDD family protein [Robiginitomaculum sp.]|nr:RDD family protein [Robiginitomaculum sp.]